MAKQSQHSDQENKPEINPNIGLREPGGWEMERGDGGLQVLGPPCCATGDKRESLPCGLAGAAGRL